MSWVLSITTILMLWLMGSKNIWGVYIGLGANILWVYYALSIHEYGLLLGVFANTIVQIRNLILWRKS